MLAAALALAAPSVDASPNVPLDDPVHDELDLRELAGELPPFRGGLAPLTESRIHELSGTRPADMVGAWFVPIQRASLSLALVHDTPRSYSTPARPRDVAGSLDLSCEYQAGRPCGNGQGLDAELDTAAGYGPWISAALRLRLRTGRDAYTTGVDLDRAYLNAELGPIAAELGRDLLVLGPTVRTDVGWSANAPPLDHLRLSGARPLPLASWLRVNAVYVLGRLADPQTYPHDLVSIARAQLDIADRIQLGGMQLLQLGGDGAPRLGFTDFLLEHVRRHDASASASDSSNRRVGFDLAVRFAGFAGMRLTYQIMFEDLRKQFASALRYDTDHALGIATRWLSVEWRKTGERAYEHIPRSTGFTTGGAIVGEPLGPGAHAVFVGGRIPLSANILLPWAEVAKLSSDTYSYGDGDVGPVEKIGAGVSELRFRIGARAHIALTDHLELTPEAALELVEREAFLPGARRTNAMLRAALVWRPIRLRQPDGSPR